MTLTAFSPSAKMATFWLGMVALVMGLLSHRMWAVLPWVRAGEYAVAAVVVAAMSWALSRLFRVSFATACGTIWLGALGWYAGVLPVLATLLLASAALGVGSLLAPAQHPARLSIAVVAGMAIIAAAIGWTLILPIHDQWVYALALAAIVVLRQSAIRAHFAALASGWREAQVEAPWSAAAAVMVLGLASMLCWLPTVGSDDLAYHLGLPWQLQTLGYYRLDAASNVWALAPWTGDVLHAVVQLVAGQEGRGALNALWLLLTASLLWRLGEGAGLNRALRWLAVALYVSHPLTASLLGQMQTETPATAGLLALALVIQRAPERPDAASLRLIAVLAGFLLALKLSLALALVPMGFWLLWRWRGRLPWAGLPLALLLGLVIAGSSYAYSWYISGNPVLPLLNGIFRSQYFAPVNFKPPTYPAGLYWTLPWDLIFDTDRHMESLDGAGGFVLIALAGALIVAISDRSARPLALVGIACFLLPLTQSQYLRYAHPAMALLVPAMLAGARVAVGERKVIVVATALCVLNVMFVANAQQTLAAGLLRLRVVDGADAAIARFAPEREVDRYLREHDSQFLALYPSRKRAFAAELGGRALVTNWYDRQLEALRLAADTDTTGRTWRQVFALTGATHVVFLSPMASPALTAALRDSGATQVLKTTGQAELWRLPPPAQPNTFMDRRNIARRLLPVAAAGQLSH